MTNATEVKSAPPVHDDKAAAMEREIDELLAEANGDARAAIRALLHDFEALLRDALAATSRGYVRGRFVRAIKA